MITRNEVRSFLTCTIAVLSNIEEVVAVCPDIETLLQALTMFRDFLRKRNADQN